MIKAVLFDFDGTLLNRDASIVSFIHDQYRRLGRFLRHIPEQAYAERFIELDQRGYVWKDKVYAQLIQEFEIKHATMEFLLEDYLAHFQFHCVPFDGLQEMLGGLKEQGIKLGIISNGKGRFQMDNIEALGIKGHFDIILISESEGLRKPDPRIFERAMGGCDQFAELGAPIPQMVNANSFVSAFLSDIRHCIADDGRTQMAHRKWLGDIRRGQVECNRFTCSFVIRSVLIL